MTMLAFQTPEGLMGDRRVRVTVAGAGGTGGMVLDGLARLDCALRAQGHAGMDVTVHDPDSVSISNVGRQRFTRSDVGFNKAILMVHRLNAFYGLDWEAAPFALKPSDAGRCDLLVGCVDIGKFRYAVGERNRAKSTEALWLDLGNGADTGQVVLGHLGHPFSAPLRLPNVYDLYGRELLAGDDDDLPSCSLAEALTRQRWSINAMVAQAGLVLLDNLFHRGGLDEHGALVRIAPLGMVGLKVDPAVWATFGYEAPVKKAA